MPKWIFIILSLLPILLWPALMYYSIFTIDDTKEKKYNITFSLPHSLIQYYLLSIWFMRVDIMKRILILRYIYIYSLL